MSADRPSQEPSAAGLLVRASLVMTAAAVVSRILGWIRLLVIGAQFGASSELDAYLAAFRIPDAIFQLVVAGALSAALIPVYASYRARGEEDDGWALASSVINLVVIGLAALSAVMAIFAPWLVPIIAPGFDAETTALTVQLTQIMLLSPVFIGLGAVFSGLLQAHGTFGPTAIAPLVYNLAIIAAAVFVAPFLGIEALAAGVVVGAFGHLIVQVPALRRLDPHWRPRIDLRHRGVRRVGLLMGPRFLGVAAGQINLIVSTALASGLAAGSVTAFTYAFQLSQLPVGIIGVSLAVALFPTLSRDAALGRASEIRRHVNASIRVLFFVSAPLAVMMIVLREPLASVFFEYGLFSAESAQRTASALAWFAIGVPAHVVVHVLARAFYAMQDTWTPVVWAVVAVVSNIVLMLILVDPYGVEGLALALSVSATIEVLGLLVALRRRLGTLDGRFLLSSVLRSSAATVIAGATMLGTLAVLDQVAPGLGGGAVGRLLTLLVPAAAGGLVYLVAALVLRAPELDILRRLVRR
ncbi:MAG TPA: murein biosynthesis integral membrane protein MurJ [Candidatus Limnocylindria bacterium]|jgi:putative peptidoglycan lipid II flippase